MGINIKDGKILVVGHPGRIKVTDTEVPCCDDLYIQALVCPPPTWVFPPEPEHWRFRLLPGGDIQDTNTLETYTLPFYFEISTDTADPKTRYYVFDTNPTYCDGDSPLDVEQTDDCRDCGSPTTGCRNCAGCPGPSPARVKVSLRATFFHGCMDFIFEDDFGTGLHVIPKYLSGEVGGEYCCCKRDECNWLFTTADGPASITTYPERDLANPPSDPMPEEQQALLVCDLLDGEPGPVPPPDTTFCVHVQRTSTSWIVEAYVGLLTEPRRVFYGETVTTKCTGSVHVANQLVSDPTHVDSTEFVTYDNVAKLGGATITPELLHDGTENCPGNKCCDLCCDCFTVKYRVNSNVDPIHGFPSFSTQDFCGGGDGWFIDCFNSGIVVKSTCAYGNAFGPHLFKNSDTGEWTMVFDVLLHQDDLTTTTVTWKASPTPDGCPPDTPEAWTQDGTDYDIDLLTFTGFGCPALDAMCDECCNRIDFIFDNVYVNDTGCLNGFLYEVTRSPHDCRWVVSGATGLYRSGDTFILIIGADEMFGGSPWMVWTADTSGGGSPHCPPLDPASWTLQFYQYATDLTDPHCGAPVMSSVTCEDE